jgi:SAM-dependent methyltransferase
MTAGLDDRYAAGYDDGMQEYLKFHTVERCASFFTPHLRPGMSLLDAGCGPGTITTGLAPLIAPGRITAVDASQGELEKTRRALETAGSDSAHLEVADVQNLPFADGSFDAVFSHAVIDYLPEPARAVEEFKRVLKPGGVLGLRSWAGTVFGPSNELIKESLTLWERALAESGGTPGGLGLVLGSILKNAGFDQIFTRPSYERSETLNEWKSFAQAFGAVCTSGRFMETALNNGWISRARQTEIAQAWESFVSDTSNCLGFSWVEAVAFKPV